MSRSEADPVDEERVDRFRHLPGIGVNSDQACFELAAGRDVIQARCDRDHRTPCGHQVHDPGRPARGVERQADRPLADEAVEPEAIEARKTLIGETVRSTPWRGFAAEHDPDVGMVELDLAERRDGLAPGPVWKATGRRHEYQRWFVAPGGGCRPLLDPGREEAGPDVVLPAKQIGDGRIEDPMSHFQMVARQGKLALLARGKVGRFIFRDQVDGPPGPM